MSPPAAAAEGVDGDSRPLVGDVIADGRAAGGSVVLHAMTALLLLLLTPSRGGEGGEEEAAAAVAEGIEEAGTTRGAAAEGGVRDPPAPPPPLVGAGTMFGCVMSPLLPAPAVLSEKKWREGGRGGGAAAPANRCNGDTPPLLPLPPTPRAELPRP